MIRRGTMADIPALKEIADAHKDSLGFVSRPELEESIEKGWLLVEEDEQPLVRGFCHPWHGRHGRTMIYHLCVATAYQGQGIGKLLVHAMEQEARNRGQQVLALKCVVGLPANDFYQALGFTLVKVEPGKRRALNLWCKELVRGLWEEEEG